MQKNEYRRDSIMKQKIMNVSLVCLFWVPILIANTQKSNVLVAEAWQDWGQNDQRQIEQKFMAVIEADQNNTRAYLGLSYLYNMQQKYEDSWMAFKNALKTKKNIYPYIFSTWLTPKFRRNFDTKNFGIINLLEELTEKADADNILKAMANNMLGDYYFKKGNLAKSKQYFRNLNAITNWMLIGPFDNTAASGFDKVYPPELECDVSKSYEGKNGVPAKWFPIKMSKHDGWIDFRRHFAYLKSVFYANNFVYSPKRQIVQIRIGTSGSLKAFLNDELLIQWFDENNNDLDTYIVETELQQDWNRLLIKCGLSDIEKCNFMVRITNAQGEAIEGLKISNETKSYQSKPGAPTKSVENFAETFFKQKIKENPNHLENYLLLADCYLRNDKAVEAELVLRDAIRLSPNCALLYHHILEAYQRGEKDDEIATTIEKIYSLDKDIPCVLKYKIEKYLKNEELDKAEEFIKHLEQLLPESELVYEHYLGLYAKKKQFEKIIEMSNKAYQQYPINWAFAYMEAAISIQKTRKYDRSIAIFKKYLDEKYTPTALISLATTYLKASNIKKWQKTYQRGLEYDPAATGYYYNMANTYIALQNYDKAEKAIKKAIDLCPNSPNYWAKLGEIHRIKNEIHLSKQAYQEALNYQPTNYDARNVLRELEGKNSIFSQFETIDIDSLIKNSPDASSYPEDDGVILLDDAKRVVYERGASELLEEMLIKVFNNQGIDDFKEYWIDYHSYTQILMVEKAVVIKSDGSEIKADIDDNHIVFKSLEANDFIYLKWRIKNYYSGKLANHYWDTFYFNCFYPMKIVQYALLTPRNSFKFNTQNMPNDPLQKQTADGTIYKWSLKNEPAIEYEYDMPGLNDVGKILYISSIEDWEYIVEWYADLVRTRARSSYEIEELVQALVKGKENSSEAEKIKTIYNFITENIRYSYVPFRQSGLIPQKARDVLVTSIGDCKDKSTLCIAMLRELGIKAHYVLLNTKDDGRNLNVLPSLAFNHCIIGVETKNGLIYLDPTAYNYPMGSLPEMDINGFSLLIKPAVKAPEYISRHNVMPSTIFRNSIVETRDDNSISVQVKTTKTSTSGALTRDYFRHEGQIEREKMLTELLSEHFPNVKLNKFEIEDLNTLKPDVNYTYYYEVPNYVMDAEAYKFLRVPWSDAREADQALSYEERKYPYLYWPRADTTIEEIEIHLPTGFEPVKPIEDVKLSSSVADYTLKFVFSNGVLSGRRKLINKKRVVSPEEYLEFKKFYNDVVKEDNKQILLKNNYLRMVEKSSF